MAAAPGARTYQAGLLHIRWERANIERPVEREGLHEHPGVDERPLRDLFVLRTAIVPGETRLRQYFIENIRSSRASISSRELVVPGPLGSGFRRALICAIASEQSVSDVSRPASNSTSTTKLYFHAG
jgi:hypothetical protein